MKFRYPSVRITPLVFAASIVLVAVSSTLAGEAQKPAASVEKKEASLLSFADGMLTFDVEQRLRVEARNDNRDFNDAIDDPTDDSWFLSRFRLGLAFQPKRWLKFYGQFQDASEFESDRADIPGVQGAEGDNSDLRQAYVEFADYKTFPLGLTLGRQRLQYGDGRLVADSRWGNFGRTFDAVRLRYQRKDLWVDAFASRPVQIKTGVFDDSDAADNLFGIYGATEALRFQTTEFYFLYRDKGDNQPDLDPANKVNPRGAWNGPAQRIATIGTRWQSQKGALHGWDYRLEFAYQWGDLWQIDRSTLALDHHAFAAHISGGYTWEKLSWHPRLGLEYDFASGDRDPNDGNSESFQNLFPSNHDKYGYMDEFAWRNIHDARVQFTADVTKNVQIDLNYHAFWLADTSDYWYRSNGYSILRTTTPDGRDVRTIGASNYAGQEIDFVVRWNARKWLVVDAGYSHFFAGAYLRDTGPSDDADFGYVQATVTF